MALFNRSDRALEGVDVPSYGMAGRRRSHVPWVHLDHCGCLLGRLEHDGRCFWLWLMPVFRELATGGRNEDIRHIGKASLYSDRPLIPDTRLRALYRPSLLSNKWARAACWPCWTGLRPGCARIGFGVLGADDGVEVKGLRPRRIMAANPVDVLLADRQRSGHGTVHASAAHCSTDRERNGTAPAAIREP